MKLVLPAALGTVTSNIPETEHLEWEAGSTYGLGDRVMVAAAHRIYESAIAGNAGKNPAAHAEAWIDAGPTNRWAMFAADAGLRTVADSGSIVVAFSPSVALDSLGLLDFDASTIRVRIMAGATELYDQTRDVAGASATVFLDIPHSAGATITVTIAPPAGGKAAVGKLLAGSAMDMGETETGASASLTDYSLRETDNFGVTTLVRRGWAKRFSVRTILEAAAVDQVQQAAAAARATPALWIGSEAHGSLIAYGYFKDFQIEVQLGTACHCSLEVEGLPSADGLVPVLDPAAQGPSNFLVIDPVRVTETVLASSNVAEDDAPLWNTTTAYALGAKVRWGLRVYESVIPANLNTSPMAGSAAWLDIGPLNRWAMFDEALGSATTRSAAIVVRFTVPEAVQGLAVLDTDAASVQVVAPGYDRTQAPDGGSAVFLDLAAAAGQSLTVTITPRPGQAVSVGTLLFGPIYGLGVTQNLPTVGITDYSVKTTDAFGNTTAVPRAWAKRLNAQALIATDAADAVLRRLAHLRATPAVWIADREFDSLTVYGFFRDFTVELSENTSLCSFNIEGLTAASVTDSSALLPPSWADIRDDDPERPKPQDGATVGAPPGTSVGGKPVEEVLDKLQQLDADMAAAGLVIDGLIETYGTTASAAASAIAAEEARGLAAQILADTQDAQSAAHESAGLSASAADEAQGAATASRNSAGAASASADAAGSSAATASEQASISITKAGEAGNSATSAALSKVDAEGHKNAAATSAGVSASAKDVALAAARTQLPAAVAPELLTTGTMFGTPATRPPIDAARIVGGVFTVTEAGVSTIQVLPWIAGRVYEVMAVVEGLGFPTQSFGYFERLNPDYSRLATLSVAGSNVQHVLDGQKKTVSYRLGCGVGGTGTGIATVAECQHFRAAVLMNREPASAVQVPGATTKLYSFTIKDVTERYASETAATASQLSADKAEASATASGSHALTSSDQAGIATTQAGRAETFSNSSASSAASAEGSANAAQMSAGVAASTGQGALNKNAGFDNYLSAAVGAFPTGWAIWSGTSHYRVPDPQGGYALRMPAAGSANVGVIQNLSDAQLLTANGYYVIEADVFLHVGGFVGSGVLFTVRSQTATNLENLWLHFSVDPDITGTVQSVPVAGRAYSFRKLVKIGAGDARGFHLYALTKHLTLGGGNTAAADIEWRKLLVRPATQTEIRDQTVLEPMQASVTSQQTAITTIESSLASHGTTLNSLGITVDTQASALTTMQNGIAVMAAQWTTAIDANGVTIGRIKLDGTGFTSRFEVMASVFRVVNPGGGAAMTWADGVLWNKGASHSVILGQNFGNQSNLLFWAGPNPSSPAAATKANGVFWIDRTGNAYFGGSLSAGVLKNAAQTTLYTKPAEVILGPFSTNGANKLITLSYSLECSINIGYDQPGYTSRPVQATIQLHRSINGGAWTLVDTLTANGTSQVWAATDIGSGLQIVTASGSKTLNDATAATSNIRFRATLVNWKLNGVETALPVIPAYDSYGNQTISVISVEG